MFQEHVEQLGQWYTESYFLQENYHKAGRQIGTYSLKTSLVHRGFSFVIPPRCKCFYPNEVGTASAVPERRK